ncbi:MAG: hypothetical protein RBR65_02890 [Aliarcobacter sp.]|jgi:phage anti-repressor protein|nr:hypothetical protein [Aliarcobacter sp.]
MKKYSISSIFILTFLNISSLNAMDSFHDQETNISSILKIKPEIKYDENLKYQEINKYTETKDKEIKSNYDFGVDVDVNRELRTLDSFKIDVGTNF